VRIEGRDRLQSAFGLFPRRSSPSPHLGRSFNAGSSTPAESLAVAVNGRIRALTRPFEKDGVQAFPTTLVPKTALVEGAEIESTCSRSSHAGPRPSSGLGSELERLLVRVPDPASAARVGPSLKGGVAGLGTAAHSSSSSCSGWSFRCRPLPAIPRSGARFRWLSGRNSPRRYGRSAPLAGRSSCTATHLRRRAPGSGSRSGETVADRGRARSPGREPLLIMDAHTTRLRRPTDHTAHALGRGRLGLRVERFGVSWMCTYVLVTGDADPLTGATLQVIEYEARPAIRPESSFRHCGRPLAACFSKLPPSQGTRDE
jgi:hypothetical protein